MKDSKVVVELKSQVEELECMLVELESRLCTIKVKKEGRKEQVLAILTTEGPVSVDQMAKILNITPRNISSQLSYLRKDGVAIGTNSLGKKFIES